MHFHFHRMTISNSPRRNWRAIWILFWLAAIPLSAPAQLLEIQQKVFGMD
jgi:hypothetical protein